MNKENRANDHDDDAGRANAKQHPGADSEPVGNLREPDEVTIDRGCVEKSGEALRTRFIKSAKQNRTTVIKEGSSTRGSKRGAPSSRDHD